MLNTPVIFTTILYSEIRDGVNTGNDTDEYTGVNILLDSEEIELPKILNYIQYSKPSFIYSLSTTTLQTLKPDHFLPVLYTLHTLSLNTNGNVIPVFSDVPGEPDQPQKMIKDYYLLQGEPDVEFARFDPGRFEVRSGILVTTGEQLNLLNDASLNDYSNKFINRVIVHFKDSQPAVSNSSVIDLAGNNNNTRIFLETIMLKAYNTWLRQQLGLWQKRTELYLSFVSLTKKVGENQYYDLREWYKNEYEMLPLWYKRVGHLVNVLRGKRRFRSLFDDNTKKYKK